MKEATKMNKNKPAQRKRLPTLGALLACVLLSGLASGLAAHKEGHETPNRLPPLGPNGGKYGLMKYHFAEVVVRKGEVHVYVVERDLKVIVQNVPALSLAYEIPGRQKRTTLQLSRSGTGFKAPIDIPRGARRVNFFVTVELEGEKESGVVLYEPRRD